MANMFEVVEAKHEFKRFIRKEAGFPQSLYRRKCDVDAENCCGGEGSTCAPADAPEDFEELLKRFCQEYGYDYEALVDVATGWINALEQEIP